MHKWDVQKYYERPFAALRTPVCSGEGYRLAIKGYPWYILSHPKPIKFVLEATKISQGYLDFNITKMG
jgi:hypothetical protein